MPKLSIVIAVLSQDYDVEPIERACNGMDTEIVLVTTNPAVVPASVKVVLVEPRCLEQRMRLAGVAHAAAQRVAVLGERYEIGEGWVEAALAACGDVAVGCIAPPRNPSYSDWAIYLSEYSHVAPPVHACLPQGNVVYSSVAGGAICFDPGLTVSFARPPGLREYLRERYRESVQWAAEQHARVPFLSAFSRIGLPALLLWRRARNVFSRRRYRVRFLAALPYLLLFSVVEATGEMVGFLSDGVRET